MSHLHRVRLKESSPFTYNQSELFTGNCLYLGLRNEEGSFMVFSFLEREIMNQNTGRLGQSLRS